MKKTKFLTVVALCLLIVSCVALSACQTETGFKVALDFNAKQGIVTVGAPTEGKLYDSGETVKVTVTPAEGYELDEFKVSGHEDAALVDGSYEFAIDADTTINVTFKKGFKVALDFNTEQGTVTVAAPTDGTLYDSGETVKVTVTPAEGYAVDEFKVSGHEDAALVDGSYEFAIDADTTINVTFKKLTFEVKLTVTTTDGGSATLTPDKPNNIYEYGDTVTLKLAPAAGYVADVKVNGNEANYKDNELSLTVNSKLEIGVSFVLRTESVLNSLKNSVIFEGVRIEKDYIAETEVTGEIRTTYDAAKKAVLTEHYENGEPMRVWLYQEGENGNAVQLTHDMKGNLIKNEVDYPFEDYFNPFNLLTVDDLQNVEGNDWIIKEEPEADFAKTRAVVGNILGYDDNIDSFVMHEENGKITSIEFSFVRSTYIEWGEDSQYFFELNVKDRGTASIDEEYFGNYKLTAEHRAIKAALTAASEAESYTVSVKGGELDYTLYYTPDGIYIDEKENECGYAVRPDGNIWSYVYDTDTKAVEFEEIAVNNKTIDYYKAVFTLKDDQGEYYVLLKSLGDGKYIARPADVYDSYCELASFFGLQVATSPIQIESFDSATSFAVTIKDDKLFTIEMDCKEIGHLTLTFDNWNSAALPIDIPENALNGLIDKAYSGIWASENGDTMLRIDLDQIMIGDPETSELKQTAELTALQGGGYGFTADGKSYTIQKSGDNLTLKVDDTAVTLYNCPWFHYIGLFLGRTEDGQDVDVTITASKIDVMIGNTTRTATDIKFEQIYIYDEDYSELAYQFTFNLGEEQYILQQANYGYDMLVFAAADDPEGTGLYRDKYQELTDWEAYLGTYIGEGYSATIEADKITIGEIGAQAEEVEDLVFYMDWDYNNEEYYYQFSFTYKQSKCVFQVIPNGMFFVIDADKPAYKSYYLMDEDFEFDYSDFYGVYSGESYPAAVAYTVELSEDGISITIGSGEKTQADVVYLESVESYAGAGVEMTLKIGETTYYLTLYPTSGSLQVGQDYIFLYPAQE